MRLNLLVPTIVDFSSAPGSALRDAVGYEDFWQARAGEASDVLHGLVPSRNGEAESSPPPMPTISIDHQRSEGRSNRYRTIGKDSLERPLHVLTMRLASEHLPIDPDDPTTVTLHQYVNEVTCRLYDHDMMLVEVGAEVDAWFADAEPGEIEARTDQLQLAAVELGAAIAHVCHERYVTPLLDWLRRNDRDEAVVVRADDLKSCPSGQEPGNALWVARALVVDPAASPQQRRVLRHWVKDIPQGDHQTAPPADMLLAGDLDHLTRWLNYAYMANGSGVDPLGPGGRFEDEWDALRCAQYFYAALDTVDSRLSMVLAEAFTADSRWELNQLKDELAELSGRAKLVLMEFGDVTKYLKRSVREEMDDILEYWSFDDVVAKPVADKVEACQERLSDLSAKQAAHSALFTDLILLGIGVTSVLGTAVALAEFWRVMASDPSTSTYDVAGDDLTGWFAGQPADAILVVSGALSVLLVIVYLYFRRSHDA